MTRGRVALAILAAGGSRRMGRPKQLLPFRERTLLRHAVETAVASGCRPIAVVIGANAELIRDDLQPLPVLIADNREWESGIGSSLRLAIETLGAFEDIEGILITLSDQPLVTADALNRIVETHYETGKDIVASEYADTFGVPVLIGRRLFAEVAALDGDEGARSVIARHLEDTTTVPLVEAAFDVDTTVDYERLKCRTGFEV
jgi:molybdenum cofactor cytidylyltransferase